MLPATTSFEAGVELAIPMLPLATVSRTLAVELATSKTVVLATKLVPTTTDAVALSEVEFTVFASMVTPRVELAVTLIVVELATKAPPVPYGTR